MTTFCLPGARFTFFCANILILFLTTSMPLHAPAQSQPPTITKLYAESTHNRIVPVVGGVELEHTLPVVGSQQSVRQAQNAGSFASTGRALNRD